MVSSSHEVSGWTVTHPKLTENNRLAPFGASLILLCLTEQACHYEPGGGAIVEVGPENSAVAGVKFTFIHGKSSPQPRTARDIQLKSPSRASGSHSILQSLTLV